jgi:hypothetical protein
MFYGVIANITLSYHCFFFFAGVASDQKLRGRLRANSKPSSSAPENALTSPMFIVLTVTIARSNMQVLFPA